MGYVKRLFGSQAEAASTTAISLYTDWAIKQGWICVDSDAVELDVKENTQRLSQIIICLTKPAYFTQGQAKGLQDSSLKASVFKVKVTN